MEREEKSILVVSQQQVGSRYGIKNNKFRCCYTILRVNWPWSIGRRQQRMVEESIGYGRNKESNLVCSSNDLN